MGELVLNISTTNLTCVLQEKLPSGMFPEHRFCNLQLIRAPGRILPVAGPSVNSTLVIQRPPKVVPTYLVLKENVPDVFCHSGRSQNVTRTFLVVLGVDPIVEHVPVIPDQSESAGRESERAQVGIDSHYPT